VGPADATITGMDRLAANEDTACADFLATLDRALPGAAFWEAPALVGVSGGADSVALLVGLRTLAERRPPGTRLIVVHAQHDLRLAAAADAEFTARIAAGLGLACVCRDLRVRVPDGTRGEGIEGRARRLRLAFFADVAREHGARHVAVAHTADDQVETILHRALRGTGLAGLSGMAPARELCDGVALVRPLLAVPRAILRRYLAACGQSWREDETNADVRHARNFLRHEILARCAAGPYPAIRESLVRLGGQAAVAAGALASAAMHLLDTHARRHDDGTIALRAGAFCDLDPHLVAEIFVALWRREAWPRRDMTARHYAALARMAALASDPLSGPPPLVLPGGVRASLGEMGAGLMSISRRCSGQNGCA
jgi:tRNA(Ile)-lysidine synthase